MSQRLLVTGVFVLLITLAACAQSTLQAQPLNITPPKDPCTDVQCGANMQCDAGSCVCTTGFKKCGASCIGERACCTDKDCSTGRWCQSGACVEQPLCKFMEQWDPDRKECVCDDNAKFCAEQGKCIPRTACCTYTVCDNDQRCAPTSYSPTVCLRSDSKKCQVVHEGRIGEFFFPSGRVNVQIQNIFEGEKFDLRVNNATAKRIAVNQTVGIPGNLSVYVESLQVFGGICREEPD